MKRWNRSRRSCLSVPGSNPRFLAKAQGLDADHVLLDLEDAVVPYAKQAARAHVITALQAGDWGRKTTTVRINDATTRWAYRDVIDIVEQAGQHLDAIILPKVTGPDHVAWLDLLLGQVEQATGLSAGRIGIEAQIEDARALVRVDEIAGSSPRLEALVFGSGDFMASLGMRSPETGVQPQGYSGEDAFHYPRLRMLVAARAHGLQAIDGRHAVVEDTEGLRAAATSAAALGYDGKWVIHPEQIEVVNAAFSPSQAEYDRAELILEAYEYYTSVENRGAVLLNGEMIDEASRKLAMVAAARGRAAGLIRTSWFQPPD